MSPIETTSSRSSKSTSQVVPLLVVRHSPPVAEPDVEHRRIRLQHGEVVDAAAHDGGADVAEGEAGKRIRRRGRRASGAGGWRLTIGGNAAGQQGGQQGGQQSGTSLS